MNPREIPIPTRLESERLVLTATREEDAARVNAAVLASWPELSRWMPWARVKPNLQDSIFHARSFVLKWESRQELDFCFQDKHGFVGKGGLHTLDWNAGQAEIGYWLDSKFTKRGFATEATLLLCDFAWNLEFKRLEIRCDARNIASQNVAKRAGFALESHQIGDRFDNSGQLADTLIWTRFR